jgi:hypothetical protein
MSGARLNLPDKNPSTRPRVRRNADTIHRGEESPLSVRSAVARFNHNENAPDQLSLWTLAAQPAWRISML